jgi:hypothetical protein
MSSSGPGRFGGRGGSYGITEIDGEEEYFYKQVKLTCDFYKYKSDYGTALLKLIDEYKIKK